MQRLEIRKILSWFFERIRYPLGKPKKYSEGELHYISGTKRHIGILIDLALVVFMLQVIYAGFFFFIPKDEATFKAIEKYRVGVELKKEEKILKNKYLYKVLSLQVAQLTFVFVYHVYMWVRFGGTVGCLLFRLRVVDEDTLKHLSVAQALKRGMFSVLSILPLGLGFIWASFSTKKQTFHDILAHTVV
ncbi:RDD family protein, partial [Anaplasma bovis]|uniref:RDD family protein n=1 Tax=Anaplasma bovis TaxID=186733 RepID=UPI002FF0B46B